MNGTVNQSVAVIYCTYFFNKREKLIFVSVNIESCENLAAIIARGLLKMLFLSCRSKTFHSSCKKQKFALFRAAFKRNSFSHFSFTFFDKLYLLLLHFADLFLIHPCPLTAPNPGCATQPRAKTFKVPLCARKSSPNSRCGLSLSNTEICRQTPLAACLQGLVLTVPGAGFWVKFQVWYSAAALHLPACCHRSRTVIDCQSL